jgi:hypothetical protein
LIRAINEKANWGVKFRADAARLGDDAPTPGRRHSAGLNIYGWCGSPESMSDLGMYAYRRKPAHWLGYPPGSVASWSSEGFLTVCVHCVGTVGNRRCYHQGRLVLAALPDATWNELCPWMRCTACGNVGFVNLAIDWTEVVDFNSPGGRRKRGEWRGV